MQEDPEKAAGCLSAGLAIAGLFALIPIVGLVQYRISRARKDGSMKGLGPLPDPRDFPNPRDEAKEAMILDGETAIDFGYPVCSPDLMTALLRREGYRTTGISYNELNRKSVEEVFRERAGRSSTESRTFIHFAGHGNIPPKDEPHRRGALISDGYDVLEPGELYEMAGEIKGRKAIMMDCCNAGLFTDFLLREENRGMIEDYVVIGACPDGKISKVSERGVNGRVGDLTFGFYQLVEAARKKGQPVDLSTADIRSGTTLDRFFHALSPSRLIGQNDLSYGVQRVSDGPYVL